MVNKIFLFGYYGFDNLGDELLCAYYTSVLVTYFPEVRVIVLTHNMKQRVPENVLLISRWNLWQIAKLMNPGDLLVGGGGSVFQDITSKRSLLYYSALLRLAYGRGMEIILAGQGIGPLSPLGRKVASFSLNLAHSISCRDQWSLGTLVNMGVTRPELSLGVDPLWDLSDQVLKVDRSNRQSCGSSIGFIFRKDNLLQKLSLLENLKLKFGDIKLITLFPGDYHAADKLGQELGGSPPVLVQEVNDFTALVPELSLVIGEKLHGLLLAARCGLPGIGLSSDPKIKAFCQQMEWSCFSGQDIDCEELMLMAVAEIHSDLDTAVLHTAEKSRVMEVKAKEEREWVLRLIGETLAKPQASLVSPSTL